MMVLGGRLLWIFTLASTCSSRALMVYLDFFPVIGFFKGLVT